MNDRVRAMRLWVAHVVDKFDHNIVGHRWQWLCDLIALRLFRDDDPECHCEWCVWHRQRYEEIMRDE